MFNAAIVTLSRQAALQRALDATASNVANLATSGFKRWVPAHEAAPLAGTRPGRERTEGTRLGAERLDLSQGALERTGAPLDVALVGEGFLAVETPRGPRYARGGALSLDASGTLVTASGRRVLGEGGPISPGTDARRIEIAADGTVSTEAGDAGRLRVVRFADPASLVPEGDGLYAAGPPLPDGGATRVESGALERSNVSPVAEAARLVEVSRAYAAVTGAANQIDELRRAAVERMIGDRA